MFEGWRWNESGLGLWWSGHLACLLLKDWTIDDRCLPESHPHPREDWELWRSPEIRKRRRGERGNNGGFAHRWCSDRFRGKDEILNCTTDHALKEDQFGQTLRNIRPVKFHPTYPGQFRFWIPTLTEEVIGFDEETARRPAGNPLPDQWACQMHRLSRFHGLGRRNNATFFPSRAKVRKISSGSTPFLKSRNGEWTVLLIWIVSLNLHKKSDSQFIWNQNQNSSLVRGRILQGLGNEWSLYACWCRCRLLLILRGLTNEYALWESCKGDPSRRPLQNHRTRPTQSPPCHNSVRSTYISM